MTAIRARINEKTRDLPAHNLNRTLQTMATLASNFLCGVLFINGWVTGRRSIGDEVGDRRRKKRLDSLRTKQLATAHQANRKMLTPPR